MTGTFFLWCWERGQEAAVATAATAQLPIGSCAVFLVAPYTHPGPDGASAPIPPGAALAGLTFRLRDR